MVALSDLRSHLGLTDGVAEDDDPMLERMLAAAKGLVEATLGYALADRYPDGHPEALDVAALQIAATWYERRESVTAETVRNLPFAAEAILDAYRDRSF